MDDLTELLKRIYNYSNAYKNIDEKPPLFRLTPYEHKIFLKHLESLCFIPSYHGELPIYMGINFELVGNPLLFNGSYIRSDSGIEFNNIKSV